MEVGGLNSDMLDSQMIHLRSDIWKDSEFQIKETDEGLEIQRCIFLQDRIINRTTFLIPSQ